MQAAPSDLSPEQQQVGTRGHAVPADNDSASMPLMLQLLASCVTASGHSPGGEERIMVALCCAVPGAAAAPAPPGLRVLVGVRVLASGLANTLKSGVRSVECLPRAAQCLAQLLRLRHLVSATIAKQDEDRTQRFLFAASRGDARIVRSVRTPAHAQQGSSAPGPLQRRLPDSTPHVCYLFSNTVDSQR